MSETSIPETEQPTVDEPDTKEPQEGGANRREARYRRQLRDTETERDQLRTQVEALQRATVERIAADILAKPAALWAAGTTLADLLADDGGVDHDKVTDAARAAQEALGVTSPPRPDPTQGGMGVGTTRTDPWSEAFAPRR